MKKIMFSDKYCLTKAVLDGTKTMTRRLLKEGTPLGNWEETAKCLPYKVGEVVAIAQNYKEVYPNADFEMVDGNFMTESAGWTNKMFVRADLMPRHIEFTDVKAERLQDISDEDCLREGIRYYHSSDKRWSNNSGYGYHIPKNGLHLFDTPYEAFANLFERISGKGTWESNPWVAAYEFKLID
ncbi:hypothetical protein [uncultured Prevotella sp.]|uniref:hypothetical protein n=1 Tax=uncultured Prevotella sp. TaxID=159272 RepID=UPI002803AED6|nr:hypothetical protein [uncultured Prevotella sp.]